jgi:hypothetical protein
MEGWRRVLIAHSWIRAFNEYFKAYSVAVMNGRERPELAYGGKSKIDRIMNRI